MLIFIGATKKTSVNITLRRALIMDAKWPIKTKLDHSTHNEMALTKKCLVNNTPDCLKRRRVVSVFQLFVYEHHQRDTSNMNKL